MQGLQKTASIVLYIVAGLSVIFAGFYYLGGTVPETIGTTFEEKNYTTAILLWTLILFLTATVITLIFSLLHTISNPKVLKGFLIVVGLGVVLFVISYLMASSAPLLGLSSDVKTTPETIKWVGIGLNATYILVIVAFFGIIASEVMRAFK